MTNSEERTFPQSSSSQLRHSLSFNQLQSLCHEIKPQIMHAHCLSFVELAAPRHYILTLKLAKRCLYLLLCLHEPLMRFHLVNNLQKKELQKASSVALQINAKLSNAILKNMELLQDDRILQLTFQTTEKCYQLIVEFFPRKPNLYLLEDMHILIALHTPSTDVYHLPAKPPLRHLQKEIVLSCQQLEEFAEQLEFEHDKRNVENEIVKLIKRAQKRFESAKETLKNSLNWQTVQHEGILLQSNLYRLKKGMVEVIVEDWENGNQKKSISLDSTLEPHMEVAKRFKKSQKLRAGIEYAESLLKKANSEIEFYTQCVEKVKQASSWSQLRALTEQILPKKNKAKGPRLPYREFHSISGSQIWVGKSAKDNEKLTFILANGNDWWFHVQGYSGSHVILRTQKNQEPDQETILDALQLALQFSQAKDAADICITQKKYVSRLGKGRTGSVYISKQRVMHVKLDPVRLQRLKLHPSADIMPKNGD